MPLWDLQSSLFTPDHQTLDEKAAVIAVIGSESPEALNLAEIRAVCRYLREQLKDVVPNAEAEGGKPS